jgi:hypothetical protein
MPDAGLADGSVLTSANYDTYLRQQVVAQVTSGTRPTGFEGRLIAESDTDRIVCYDGANWIRVGAYSSSGRSGVNLSRISTVQSIPTGTAVFTAISWDTESTDTDNYITAPSTDITIPTGLGGFYAVTATVSWATSPGGNSSIEFYNSSTSGIWRFPIGAGTQMTSCALTMIADVAAGNVCQLRVSQGTAGAINVNATLQMWRLSA